MARDRPASRPAAQEKPVPEPPAPGPRESEVIVDVEFDAGLLYLVVHNLGELPAYGVRVKFEPPFRGLGGTRAIASLALFRRLEFLAPRKSIRLFLDRASLYFARDEPTKIEATIRWRTRAGARRTDVVSHDLEIYRDLPYAEREVDT